eukprot:2336596-Rhodomonas_salina.1
MTIEAESTVTAPSLCTSLSVQPVSQYPGRRRMSIEAESTVTAPSLAKCGHANQPSAFEEDSN